MHDILTIAAAVMIALLSQIVEPRSGPWWTGMIISAVLAIIVIIDLITKQMSSESSLLPIIGMAVCAVGFGNYALD